MMINLGEVKTIFDAVTATIGLESSVFELPGSMDTMTLTLQNRFNSNPTSLTLRLQGSLDGIHFSSIGTSVDNTGSIQNANTGVKFVKLLIEAIDPETKLITSTLSVNN